jgi:hypothetical protein
VVLLGTTWKPLVDLLEREGMLESQQIRHTRFAATPAAAVELLRQLECRPGEPAP